MNKLKTNQSLPGTYINVNVDKLVKLTKQSKLDYIILEGMHFIPCR